MGDEDPIPLEEGTLTWSDIVPDQSALDAPLVSSGGAKRAHPRKDCSNTKVCLTLEHESGRIDHIECPVINISSGGFALLIDIPVHKGAHGRISYRSATGVPVSVSCTIRHCGEAGPARYRIGVKLDRALKFEETRPARAAFGREVAPGLRPRKLKPAPAAEPTDPPSP